MNEIFLKYKDIHKGETAILFGTGDTLEDYKPIEEEAILVGVNHIGKRKLFDQSSENFITLDYYFFGDIDHKGISKGLPNKSKAWEKEFKVKREKFCACRVALEHDAEEHSMHYSCKKARELGAHPIDVHHREDVSKDISSGQLHGHSIAFPAALFLLYTGVSKIYLVGCDCSHHVHDITPAWEKLRNFCNKEYPDVKFISINPAFLQGMFEDIYTNRRDGHKPT